MNIATISPSHVVSMTSREISDVVGSRHDNVKASIVKLAARGVIIAPALQEGCKLDNGHFDQIYKLNRRDSIIVVAQMSPEYTAKLVDYIDALESKVAELLKKELETAKALAATHERYGEEDHRAFLSQLGANDKLVAENKALTEELIKARQEAYRLEVRWNTR